MLSISYTPVINEVTWNITVKLVTEVIQEFGELL